MSVARRVLAKSLNMARSKLGLWLPAGNVFPGLSDTWPRCCTCNMPVEAHGIEERSDHHVTVTARCRHHEDVSKGFERRHYDARRIEWDSMLPPTEEQLTNQIGKLKFFEKDHHDA